MSTSQLFNFSNNGGASSNGQMFNFANGAATPSQSSNQYFSAMPGMSSPNTPGIPTGQSSSFTPMTNNSNRTTSVTPVLKDEGQVYVGGTMNPQFTSDFYGWLQSQMGQGVSPFNESSVLASSGQATQPGQLSAPLTQLLQQLQASFGSNASGSMGDMLATGAPVDQTPAWQAMKTEMGRTIQEQEANLKEQFNVGGGLVGSPYGTAAADYEAQTAKGMNTQLLTAQQQALEAARGRQLQAGALGGSLGQMLQGLDQSSIDRLYQEFIRTSPQYNPLIGNMQAMASLMPSITGKKDLMAQVGAGVNAAYGAMKTGVGAANASSGGG